MPHDNRTHGGGPPAGWPFHAGERTAQQLAGAGSAGGAIRPALTDQHRRFFAQLPFVAVATTDDHGPVATLWTGRPGFVRSPDPHTLHVAVALDPADPASAAFVPGAPFGLLGIELATRRRNRANGAIAAVDRDGVTLAIHQSFGNCPNYIHPRDVATATAAPVAATAERLSGLDRDAAAAITAAATFFVATSARTGEPTGGVDISHRGGPPGFVRIHGDVLTIPDYAGNRYFNTLGNLVSDPRAALVFVDFARGDLLHLQGRTEIVWQGPEVSALGGAGTERLWRVHVERGWRRRTALALRWTAPAA
jgi:predicted pyridoxine 5'-phosphate oxidase superfamily flavin-nucleotide-binding protein